MELWQALKNHSQQQYYPFHMPGHKAGRLGAFTEILSQDITEITDFDNLHKPEGILLQSHKIRNIRVVCFSTRGNVHRSKEHI